MKIRIYNARILTSALDEIFFGEIDIDSGIIFHIGKDIGFKADREIDARGNVLAPSFANAHTHSGMSLMRGRADDKELDRWLFEDIFPMESRLSAEDIYWGSMLSFAEYVRSGVTLIGDMYFFKDAMFKAVEKSGIKCAICGGVTDFDGDYRETIKTAESQYLKYNGVNNRIKFIFGAHAEYTCSQNLLEGISDLAIKYKAPTYIHLSETLKEVGECTTRRNGLTPPQFLHKIGFFENGGLVAHCTHIDKDDIQILKSKGVSPVINSSSNLKLASGIAPVYSMLNAGLEVAIGTDGASSNNSLNMFREMYEFSVLQKMNLAMADIVKAEESIKACTINGYKALGFSGGELVEGGVADMILIDINKPNMRPITNIKKNIVYSGEPSNIIMTMCDGKILYEDGNYYIGEEIDKIFSECEKRSTRIAN